MGFEICAKGGTKGFGVELPKRGVEGREFLGKEDWAGGRGFRVGVWFKIENCDIVGGGTYLTLGMISSFLSYFSMYFDFPIFICLKSSSSLGRV